MVYKNIDIDNEHLMDGLSPADLERVKKKEHMPSQKEIEEHLNENYRWFDNETIQTIVQWYKEHTKNNDQIDF